LSKFVSRPLVLPTVTVVQVCVQLVWIVISTLKPRLTVTGGPPSQRKVIELDPDVAPLYAWTLMSRRGVTNVKAALVAPALLKRTLLVVNCCQGLDRYQTFVPQSTTPGGYCPLSGLFGFASELKSMVV
jgi:hypothetical protein